jgi:hypothetical protein
MYGLQPWPPYLSPEKHSDILRTLFSLFIQVDEDSLQSIKEVFKGLPLLKDTGHVKFVLQDWLAIRASSGWQGAS